MTLLKFASAQVLDARIAQQGAGLVKDAHRHEFDYEPRPGFLYVRSRAISSRTNDNFDHFPAEEIKKAYRTFIGKPVFVNHHNDNHRRARGVIVDAALHEDTNPDGSEDTWAEVLMEVDAVRFPKLAQAIVAGEIDRTSMGTDVAFSVCSVCNNKASTPLEYCQHIPKLKGKKVYRTTASGEKEAVLVYEKCYGLGFFENSLLVEEPADPTAYFLGVDTRGLQTAASKQADLGDGWLINGKPYADGVWIEVEPDTWYRGSAQPEIPSRMVVKRDGDKWAWQAQVLTFIGAPHEDSGWQKPGAPKGTAKTLEEAQAKAQASLAKDHEFFRQYQERQRAKMVGASKQAGVINPELTIPDYLLEAYYAENPHERPRPLRPVNRQHYDAAVDLLNPNDPARVRVVRWERDQLNPGSATEAPVDLLWQHGSKTAAKRALNETLAPAKVDTLRDESCPVCGENDTYDGDKCRVCGFIRPPDEFMEPDLEKARQVDLRQDQQAQEDAAAENPAADPNAPQDAAVEDGSGGPDFLKQEIPKDSGDPAAGGTPAWQQKEIPKDSAGGSDTEPGEAAAGQPLWKQRTRRKSAGLNTQKEQSMRPALAALAAQQKQIDGLKNVVAFIADAAGLAEHPVVTAALTKQAEDENPAQPDGWATDGNNGGTEGPSTSTEEARKPGQGTDSPENSGSTPGTDVEPDAKTSLDSTETVLDTPLDLNEQDPTKQVAGTDTLGEGQRGNAGTNRTETEVRAGDPNKPDVAFPESGWTNAATGETRPVLSEGRQIAAMRLARLRISAGIETAADDLALGSAIAASDSTDEAIQTEIETLAKVVQAAARRQPTVANRSLVPQRTATARTTPSMATDPVIPQQRVAHAPDDDEFAFE